MNAEPGTALPPRGGLKPFKGKGDVYRRFHDVQQELTVVQRQMRQLKHESRAIRGKVFALDTDVKQRRGSVMLRWRYVAGRHAVWKRDIEPSLSSFPIELQTWYRKANVASVILNVREQCLRYERSALQRLVEWLRAGEEQQSTIHQPKGDWHVE